MLTKIKRTKYYDKIIVEEWIESSNEKEEPGADISRRSSDGDSSEEEGWDKEVEASTSSQGEGYAKATFRGKVKQKLGKSKGGMEWVPPTITSWDSKERRKVEV